MEDTTDQLYARFEQRIREHKPAINLFLETMTGWKGCEDMAELVVRMVTNNLGGGGANSGMYYRLRCGCGDLPLRGMSMTEHEHWQQGDGPHAGEIDLPSSFKG